jgi:hypothetical protein
MIRPFLYRYSFTGDLNVFVATPDSNFHPGVRVVKYCATFVRRQRKKNVSAES